MSTRNRFLLKHGLGYTERIMWYLGWEPRVLNIAALVLGAAGWVLLHSPFGLLLGTIALILRWKTATLINVTYQERISEAESLVKEEGARRLGVQLSNSENYVITSGRGKSPFGVKAKPDYDITVVYIADVFFAVYVGASFQVAKFEIELPAKGEETYFRHVSAINYQDPLIEVVLANGRTMRQFKVGSVGEATVLEALRAKLRSGSKPQRTPVASVPSESGIIPQMPVSAPMPVVDSPKPLRAEEVAPDGEERHCYLRFSKLMQLYQDLFCWTPLSSNLRSPEKRRLSIV